MNQKTSKIYNVPFKCAIRKYGMNNFSVEVLDIVETEEEAIELEKYYIKKFQTYYKYKNSNGYNATIGGEYMARPKDKVYQIHLDTFEIIKIWNSISEAEYELSCNIYDAVNKPNRIAANSFWIYEKDFNSITYVEERYIARNYVCQINKDRKLIKIWRSAKMAEYDLNISQGNITMCCYGQRISAGGFYWCFYSDFIRNDFPKKADIDRTYKRCVIQFDKDGNCLETFESLTDASIKLHIGISEISEACSKHYMAGNYLWRFYDEYNGEEVSYHNKRYTPVQKLDENGNVLETYEKVSEAGKSGKVAYQGILRAIKNHTKAGGYYWKKVSDKGEK